MKRNFSRLLIPLLAVFYSFGTANSQELKTFILKGDVSNVKIPVKQVVLMYFTNDRKIRDTCAVQAGKYQFKGEISEPQLVSLIAPGDKEGRLRYIAIYIEQTEMTATSDSVFENIKMTGSESQLYYMEWQKKLAAVHHSIDSLLKLRNPFLIAYDTTKDPEDSVAMWAYQNQIEPLLTEEVKINIAYAKTHLNSPIIADIVDMIFKPEFAKEQEELFYQMPEIKQNSVVGKRMKAKFGVAVGHMSVDFSIPDTAGKSVSLSSFRGKYVLLEFWASWCGPCRKEAPYLTKAYINYKNKGFTVFSVSLDDSNARKDWLDAIHNDGTGLWTQTSLLKKQGNPVSKAWAISSIPANFLLDPQGKIIARDLRGKELEKKLKELLN